MADEQEIAAICRLAGPHLLDPCSDWQAFPQRDWRQLCAYQAQIPDSAIVATLAAAEQAIDGRFLIIGYRAQNAVVTGIACEQLDELDPPVYGSANEEGARWHREFEHASDWFCVEMLWRLVNEGRGCLGHASRGGLAAKRRLLPLATPVLAEVAKRVKLEFFALGQTALLCFCGAETYAWTETEAAWKELEAFSALSWSYCSLDDEPG